MQGPKSTSVLPHERVIHHNLAMRRLVQAIQDLSTARTLDSIMAVVRRAARDLTGADGATFVLREGEYCYYADEEAIAPLWKGQRFPLTACISGWSMLNRLPAILPDVYADPRIPADAYRPTFVKSLVMVPIRSSSPIGAIGTYWAHHRTATPEEVELLQSLANITSVAMENVRVYSELEERVRLRTRELELANEDLEAFSYSVSHDLRNPLAAIDGFAQLLAMSELGKRDAGYVERILHASGRMAKLIDDLMRLSRVSRTQLRLETVNVSEMAAAALQHLRDASPERTVECRIASGLTASADRGLLHVVLENLLNNAWKYTARTDKPVIEVGSVAQPGNSVAYFVRDNGIGFDLQKANGLFLPFRRFHNDSDFKGTGIGLATAQRVVLRHGGAIWAESSPSRGATFYFTLSPSARSAFPTLPRAV